MNDGVRRIVLGRRSRVGGAVGAGLATTTTAATAARSVGIEIGIVGILGIRISGGLGLITGFFAGSVVGLLLDCRRGRFLLRFGSGIRLFVRTLLATLFTATTSTSTASTTTATRLIVVLVLGLGALALGLRCGHSRLFDGRNCNRRCLGNDGFGFRSCLLLFDDRRCSRLAACATATRSYLGGFEIRLQEQRDLRRGGSHLGLMGLRRLEGSEQIGLLGFLALQRSSGVESSADLGDSRIHCFFCCRFFGGRFFDNDLFAGATSPDRLLGRSLCSRLFRNRGLGNRGLDNRVDEGIELGDDRLDGLGRGSQRGVNPLGNVTLETRLRTAQFGTERCGFGKDLLAGDTEQLRQRVYAHLVGKFRGGAGI